MLQGTDQEANDRARPGAGAGGRPRVVSAQRVVTMAGEDLEAFAVVGERVVATGVLQELLARFPGAEHVRWATQTIVPGFNDAHVHLAIAAEALLHVDLSPAVVRSLADVEVRLREAVARTPAGQWVRGERYDDARTAGGPLTRGHLDAIGDQQPILVVHVAGHWGVLNSPGLRLAGLDEASPDPAGGALGRDAAGRLNGVVYERALFALAYPALGGAAPIIPPGSDEERLAGLRRAVRMFHAAGLTSITDALVGPDDLRLFSEAHERGLLTLRTNVLVVADHFDTVRRTGLRSDLGREHLRLAGVKAFVDGAIGGRTCLLEEPFEGSDFRGIQSTSERELREIVRAVHAAGWRAGIHANGDRAIALLLDLLEAVQAEHPRADPRHRIEHGSVVTPAIVERMRRLGTVAVPFGSYVHDYGGRLVDWYGPQRVERMFAHRWLLDAGVPVAGSSDYPCGPFEPLLALQSCVTRLGADGVPVGTSQRITAREALGLYTVGSAYASGEERRKGRLAPGYLADFVVLEEDPLVAEPERLGAIPVRATYVGGEPVWLADG